MDKVVKSDRQNVFAALPSQCGDDDGDIGDEFALHNSSGRRSPNGAHRCGFMRMRFSSPRRQSAHLNYIQNARERNVIATARARPRIMRFHQAADAGRRAARRITSLLTPSCTRWRQRAAAADPASTSHTVNSIKSGAQRTGR